MDCGRRTTSPQWKDKPFLVHLGEPGEAVGPFFCPAFSGPLSVQGPGKWSPNSVTGPGGLLLPCTSHMLVGTRKVADLFSLSSDSSRPTLLNRRDTCQFNTDCRRIHASLHLHHCMAHLHTTGNTSQFVPNILEHAPKG